MLLLALLAQALLGQVRTQPMPSGDGGGGLIGALFGMCCYGIIFLVFFIIPVAGLWKMFEKAGKPGWAAIIPIYNYIVALEITGKPIWWIAIILLVPCANIVFVAMLCIALAKSFGKSDGYGIGMFFLPFVFFPMLGFSDARYQGPVG
jgi:hypothetical protein